MYNNLDKYPNELITRDGLVARRYYTQIPMWHEVEKIHAERNDGDFIDSTLNSLIVSLFRDDLRRYYWAFGCQFFDKINENYKIAMCDLKMLDLVDKIGADCFNDKGLKLKRDYYFKSYIAIKKRL